MLHNLLVKLAAFFAPCIYLNTKNMTVSHFENDIRMPIGLSNQNRQKNIYPKYFCIS